MLRGKAPLTVYRGAGNPGGHLYRGSVLDPRLVDADDRDRLVAEGFLEWVVADGESFKLAETTDTGSKGDPVTVGDVAVLDPNEVDGGTVNTEAEKVADPELEERRAEARSKLADMGGVPDGRSSEAVWVEYAVLRGLDRTEAEKAGKDELRKVLAGRG